jgi:leader peptidase (prepilin peptidase) / N-methyltransferase
MPFWPLEPLVVEWLLSPLMLGVLGLLVGSFLNVVIHRVPLMLQRAWKLDSAELLGVPLGEVEPAITLSHPRSRCPACGHRIAWYENLPVLSYLWLRARCSACKAPISARYPLVELLTCLLFAGVAWRWGAQPQALLWCGFCAALVALAGIDWDTTLLPDNLTQPLLWAGLLASLMGWTTALPQAVAGAVVGYLSLWSVYWLFKLATGKEGMGFGDFKLLAALGAWLGVQMILPLVLAASLVGAVVGIGMKLSGALRDGLYVPFGPFLAGAGLLVMFAGPQRVLGWMGWA